MSCLRGTGEMKCKVNLDECLIFSGHQYLLVILLFMSLWNNLTTFPSSRMMEYTPDSLRTFKSEYDEAQKRGADDGGGFGGFGGFGGGDAPPAPEAAKPVGSQRVLVSLATQDSNWVLPTPGCYHHQSSVTNTIFPGGSSTCWSPLLCHRALQTPCSSRLLHWHPRRCKGWSPDSGAGGCREQLGDRERELQGAPVSPVCKQILQFYNS